MSIEPPSRSTSLFFLSSVSVLSAPARLGSSLGVMPLLFQCIIGEKLGAIRSDAVRRSRLHMECGDGGRYPVEIIPHILFFGKKNGIWFRNNLAFVMLRYRLPWPHHSGHVRRIE